MKMYDLNDKNKSMGEKALNLSKLIENGFNVPKGFVIDSKTTKNMISNHNEIKRILNSINLKNINDKVDNLKVKFNDKYDDKILRYFNRKNLEKVAVRSSSNLEDLEKHSFAGLFESYLNIERENLISNVKNCIKSMFSKRVMIYLLQNNFDLTELNISIIVQKMVDSKYSGVIFSKNPINNDEKEIVIEISKGLGEDIVSGKKTPNDYVIDKKNQEIIKKEEKENINGIEKKLKLLTKKTKEIESIFDSPVDIEFSFDDKELFILQTRKITT